jgi:phenylacetate-CoA ligase
MKSTLKQALYFGAHRLTGRPLGSYYAEYLEADRQREVYAPPQEALADLLRHCAANVPYYAELIAAAGNGYEADAIRYLRDLPLLTKDIVRAQFERLKSSDLEQRRWEYNTSGGSTGEPVKLIQDREFQDRQMAIQLLSFQWAGRQLGEPALHIWGSVRDILKGSERWQMRILNRLSNDRYRNAFRMTPDTMRSILQQLNEEQPKLIVAYVQSLYELARFAQREGIAVAPQQAIATSAGTLYPAMRSTIESVFGCRVFDRYGSREVGDIAAECEQHAGLHVFPFGSYVEILDEDGQPVPAGMEGNIVVTNLNNYAMPLIRYAIGDRGIMAQGGTCACGRSGQILQQVSGRNVDVFLLRDGTHVDGACFFHMLRSRDWVRKFQIVQADYARVVFRVAPQGDPRPEELEEITCETRLVMGAECRVDFEFVDDIAPSPSGKYRFTISEVHAQPSAEHSEDLIELQAA